MNKASIIFLFCLFGLLSFSVNAQQNCTYSFNPASIEVEPSGGQGQFQTQVSGASCLYKIGSTVPWITDLSQTTAAGSSPFVFKVAPNPGQSRNGSINVYDYNNGTVLATLPITQSGAQQNCTYSLSPASAQITATGGSSIFTVNTQSGCDWTATSNASWITVGNPSGTGEGGVNYSVQPNTGAARSGTITVAGQMFTIFQNSECVFSFSPAIGNIISAFGGDASFDVLTQPGCSWTASSGVPWITVVSGASSTGNGTVNFTVLRNSSSVRSGNIVVGDQIT
jgi:hypothetical protein